MSLLLSDLKTVLAGLCGGTLTAAGLDGSDTSTAWMYPIASALRSLGLVPASPLTVVDADLVAVSDDQVGQLVDVAELAALEAALGNYTKVDQKISLGEIKLGQLRSELEATISRKALAVRQRYGVGTATLTAGVVDLSFDAQTEDVP